MHEFSLFSQIPSARYDQVLNVLAGIAGTQPQAIYERHLLYRPPPGGANPATKGKVQDSFASNTRQLIQSVKESDLGTDIPLFEAGTVDRPWLMRVDNVPEASLKDVISRPVQVAEVTDIQQQLERQKGSYRFAAEYTVVGQQVVYNNIVARLSQILLLPSEQNTAASEPSTKLPSISELTPLDQSGTFLFEAYVRVEDRTNSTLTDMALRELRAFRETLKGCLDLKVPDRLAMDTRVR